MSFSMFWRPAPKKVPPSEYLDDDLKRTLGRRLWGSSSLRGDALPLGSSIVPYLEGLADGGVSGARELILAIRKHGTVEVWMGDPDD